MCPWRQALVSGPEGKEAGRVREPQLEKPQGYISQRLSCSCSAQYKTGHGEGVFSPQEENNIQFGNGINKKQICCRGQYLTGEESVVEDSVSYCRGICFKIPSGCLRHQTL